MRTERSSARLGCYCGQKKLSDFAIMSSVVIADLSLSQVTGEEQRSKRALDVSEEDGCGWREDKREVEDRGISSNWLSWESVSPSGI